LEKALKEEGPAEVELAINRILLLHGIILTAGGIPLLYLGDEIGTLNDYSYQNDPAHKADSRWVHRIEADWDLYEKRKDPTTIQGKVYQGLQEFIKLRKTNPAFSGGELDIISTKNDHVLGFVRRHRDDQVSVFVNFSESPQRVSNRVLTQHNIHINKKLQGASNSMEGQELVIEPLDFLVFS
jgi:glycosidase